jgi:phospholipid-binding lipoprotein MlaA
VSGISDVSTRNILTVTRVINTRANLLKASSMLEEAALDKYAFTREAYLQRRRSVIYDGNPPDEQTSENDYEEQDAALPQTDAVATKSADTLNTAGLAGDEKVKP